MYIKSVKNNKTNGSFSISNKLFTKFKKPISTPLAILINLTFTKGEFPDILKIGKNFPIQKKNCKTDVNNYRPISLLSNISKIIGKIVHDRIYIYEITEQIRNVCDKDLYTCNIYLDLQKAFDIVNENILLANIMVLKVSVLIGLSLICDRVQCTSTDLKESSTKINSHGAPQGSGLGPLLFIIFINDLNKAVKNSQSTSLC